MLGTCWIAHNVSMATKKSPIAKQKAKQTSPQVIPAPGDPPRIAQQRVWSLVTFVADDNPSYSQFLAYLGAGATIGAAACSVRLSYPTIADWLAKYSAKSSNPLINKLGVDIEQAIGQASVVAEVQVKGSQPREWLKVASRNALGDDNPWNNANQSNAVPSPSQQTTNNILVIGAQLQHDALAALEQAGIITQRRNTESVAIDARVVDEVSKK